MATRFNTPFFDAGSGIKPSSGAQLFFFETGTNTPRDTFTNSGATIPNANPVISDSNGVFGDIFIDGSYKVQLKDKNNVQIWEADPVSPDSVFAITRKPTELITLTAGQTTVAFTSINVNNAEIKLSLLSGDGRPMLLGTDYMITSATAIELTNSQPAGTICFADETLLNLAAKPTDSDSVKKFNTLGLAKADLDLKNDDALNIEEFSAGSAGGAMWDVFPAGTFTVSAAIFDVFNHNTLPLQLKLRNQTKTTLRQLGAKGDGTDETAIIQALFTIGGMIEIEDGDFLYTSTIALTKRFILKGTGVFATPTQGSILRFTPTTPGDIAFDFNSLDYWSMEDVYHVGPGRATGTNEICLDMFNPTAASEFGWRVTGCKFEDWNKAGIYLGAQWQGNIQSCTFQKCGDTTDIPGGSVLPHTGGIVFEENGGAVNWSGSGDVINSCHFISCSYGIYNDKGWNVITLNAIYEDCGFPFFKSAAGTMMIVMGDWQEDFGNPNFKEPVIEGDVLQIGGRNSTGVNNPRYRQHATAGTEMQFNAYAGTQDCLAGINVTRHDISTAASKLRLATTNTSGTLVEHIEVTQEGHLDPVVDNAVDLGGPTTQLFKNLNLKGFAAIGDGINAAPGATVGLAKIYVDPADGDLKVIFGDGIIKTLTTDT